MYYYKLNNDFVIKYEVKLDEEKLKLLRLEIIERCSHIIYKHYYTTDTSISLDYLRVRNYKERFHRTIEYNDFYSSDEDEYEVEYDYYEFDELVNYIDLLLLYGDVSSIDLIINLKDKTIDKEEILLEKQSKIINKLNYIDNNDIKNELKKLNYIQKELEKYKEEQELNEKQVSGVVYKEKVLSCIKFNEIDRLSIETINKVNDFIEVNSRNLIKTLKI